MNGDVSTAPNITVPVLGGHSGVTILPILSQSNPPLSPNVTQSQIEELTKRIQFGGDEVVKAKDGTGSATLSMAYAGAEFASKILSALKGGGKEIITQSYVDLEADPEEGKKVAAIIEKPLQFFSVSVKLGVSRVLYIFHLDRLDRLDGILMDVQPNGIEKILPLGELNEYEKGLLKAAIPELEGSISKVRVYQSLPQQQNT